MVGARFGGVPTSAPLPVPSWPVAGPMLVQHLEPRVATPGVVRLDGRRTEFTGAVRGIRARPQT
jgi:hypothetical protein